MDNLSGRNELKKKILWTFLLLAVYRIGIHVPVPGIDTFALAAFFKSSENTLFGLFDMFSGGGLLNLSVFALGIMPYISSSIILQLLTVISPELKRMSKEEGSEGRKKITQYTRYGTVVLALFQGLGISIGLESMSSPSGASVVLDGGWSFRLITMLTLTTGTVFLMWLGERMTEKGLTNGISMIIFSGIVAGMPSALANTFRLMTTGEMAPLILLLIIVVILATLFFIVFMERGQRRIPIHYAKRMLGRKMVGGQTTHLPLKINTAGVIPPIFASSILMFPATIAEFSDAKWLQNMAVYLSPTSIVYNVIFVAAIIFFCYFYTAVVFDPKGIADNIQKQGGFVPGIRPGLKTKEYLDKILSRITLWGAFYISIICVLPQILIARFNAPFYFGGTALLIVVGVAMDFMSKLESHMISQHYEGLMAQKKKVKGR